jgi:hypothetical protein
LGIAFFSTEGPHHWCKTRTKLQIFKKVWNGQSPSLSLYIKNGKEKSRSFLKAALKY